MTSTLHEIALQRKEHRLAEHKKRHSEHQKAAYKDMLDAVPAVNQKPTLVAWILYDATADKKYIKMNPTTGSLAIFDSEEAAMSAKRAHSGTDYKRCEYYSAPQPTPVLDQEPMAWVTADTVDGQIVNGKPRRVWWENNEGVGIPLYTAPQPQPDVSTLVEALECALETMENVDGANDCSRGIDAVEEALAAYRKEGGQ